jgi:hypothetical protein
MVDVMIGKDYVIDDINSIKNDVLEEMKQGRTLQEAVDIV